MVELITQDDLETHIGAEELDQLTGSGSHNRPGGRVLDEVKIAQAIKFASDFAKGFLTKRYPLFRDLPVVDVPDLIKGYVADIARYRLRHRSGNRNAVSQEVQDRYDEARAYFRDISKGQINIDLSEVDGAQTEADANAVNPSGKVYAAIPAARAPGILDGYRS